MCSRVEDAASISQSRHEDGRQSGPTVRRRGMYCPLSIRVTSAIKGICKVFFSGEEDRKNDGLFWIAANVFSLSPFVATDNSSLSLKSEAASLSPRIVRSTTNEQPSITVVSLFLFTTLLFFSSSPILFAGPGGPAAGRPTLRSSHGHIRQFCKFWSCYSYLIHFYRSSTSR